MDQTRGERRAETAKQNDDSDIIDAANEESLTGEFQQGRSGGDVQADVATQAEGKRVADPAAHESISKGDHISHGQGESPPHPAEEVVTERD